MRTRKSVWALIRSRNQNGDITPRSLQAKTKTSHKTCAACMQPCATTAVKIGRISPIINFHQILKQLEDEKFSCEEEIRSSKALRTSIVVQNILYQTITELVSPDIERT